MMSINEHEHEHEHEHGGNYRGGFGALEHVALFATARLLVMIPFKFTQAASIVISSGRITGPSNALYERCLASNHSGQLL
jgi:hypothetical protein